MSAVLVLSGGIIGFILHHLYLYEQVCEECVIKETMLEIKTRVIDHLKTKKCNICKERKEADKILELKLEDILEGEEHTVDEPKEEGWLDFILMG